MPRPGSAQAPRPASAPAPAPIARPPTRPAARPPAPAFRRPPRRPFLGTGAAKATAGGIGVALLVGAIWTFRVIRVVSKLTGNTTYDDSVTVPPGGSFGQSVEASGSASYTLEVTAVDGEFLMSFGRVADPDHPTAREALAIASAGRTVAPGRTETMSGSVGSGKYIWVVINNSENKSARCRIKFKGR